MAGIPNCRARGFSTRHPAHKLGYLLISSCRVRRSSTQVLPSSGDELEMQSEEDEGRRDRKRLAVSGRLGDSKMLLHTGRFG
jgi:hypothetical protein